MLMNLSKATSVIVKTDSHVRKKKNGAEILTSKQKSSHSAIKRKIVKNKGIFISPVSRSVTARLSNKILHGLVPSFEVASAIINKKFKTVVGHANMMFAHEHE